jgi:predicted permease
MLDDLRLAVRALARAPVFTATAVLSLALGMGANAAFFRVADALLLRALPVRAPDELVVLARNPARPTPGYTYPEFVRVRDHGATLAGVAATASSVTAASVRVPARHGGEGPAEVAQVALVSGSYFGVLGVPPAAGRVLTAADDAAPGTHAAAVLSHAFWRRRFGGDPGVVGRTVRLDRTTFTVVGVAAPGFAGAVVGRAPDLFVPLAQESAVSSVPPPRWKAADRAWLVVLGRRRPGVADAQIAADVSARLAESGRESAAVIAAARASGKMGAHERTLDARAVVLPGARGTSAIREQAARPLLLLWAGAALVLVVACVNVAGLAFARALSRARETATRVALGATRGRLVRQALAEGALLAFAAAAVGVALATLGARGLVALLPQGGAALALDLSPGARVVGFAAAVALGAVLVIGLAPALRAARQELVPALKRGATADHAAGRGADPRAALVVAQVALSLVLLVAAGLFVRTLRNLRALDAGFAPEQVLALRVAPERAGYADGARRRAYYQQLRARLAAVPGVRAVSVADETPLDGRRWTDDLAAASGGRLYRAAELNAVGPGYFAALGVDLRAGRDFGDRDVRSREEGAGAPQAAIVSAAAARHLFPGQPALASVVGRRFSRGERYQDADAYEVVGVVDDVRYVGLRVAPTGMVYLPFGGGGGTTLVVRAAGRPEALAAAARRAAQDTDPGVPVVEARPLRERVDDDLAAERLLAALCTGFGVLAIGLAAVGLYGVLAEGVLRRTRELGVRMALGATHAGVVASVLRGAAGLVLAGVAAGGLAAAALSRLVARFLYGVDPVDPWAIGLAAAVVGAAALGAAAVPARLAARVSPAAALRQD